ncbi:MAG: hypothetical protein QXZ54_03005 [Candidatus Methanomethylicia archaeon]
MEEIIVILGGIKMAEGEGETEIFYPKEIMTLQLHKPCKIATIRVEIDPEAYYKVGILHDLSENFYVHGINILGVYSTQYPDQYGYITFFVDVTQVAEKVLDEVSKSLRGIDGVVDVMVYVSPVEGVAVDPKTMPLAMGSRAIILMKHSFKCIVEEFHKRRWWLLLNALGKEIGKAGFRDHERFVGRDIDKLFKMAEIRFSVSGFGFWETVKADVDSGEFIIRVHHSIECDIGLEIDGYTGSHFVRGVIEGWLMELMGKSDVTGFEAKCLARGDPYCEFHFKIK